MSLSSHNKSRTSSLERFVETYHKVYTCLHSFLASSNSRMASAQTPLAITYQDLTALTYAAKRAAAQVNLTYRKGCIFTKNHLKTCRYLILPGPDSRYANTGSAQKAYDLRGIIVIEMIRFVDKEAHCAYYCPRIAATIKHVYSIQELSEVLLSIAAGDTASCETPPITLNQALLQSFLIEYMNILSNLSIIRQDICDTLEGWSLHAPAPRTDESTQDYRKRAKDRELSYFQPRRIACTHPGELSSLDDYLPAQLFNEDGLWFTATIFSLLKPLFLLCEIKCSTAFVLQVLYDAPANDSARSTSLWLLERQANMWCNYRELPQFEEVLDETDSYSCKFRNHYHKPVPPLKASHCNFPTVVFGYKTMSDNDDEIEFYKRGPTLSKEYLRQLCTLECLPILIPAARPQRDYSKSQCLTLTLPSANLQEKLKYYDYTYSSHHHPTAALRQQHERILSYYMGCLNVLQGQKRSAVRQMLLRSQNEAAGMLGAKPGETDPRTDQLCSLLMSVLFIRRVLISSGQPVERLSRLIQALQRIIGIVTLEDFATFVSEVVCHSDSDHSCLFGQDSEGVYLRYKQYWPAFQAYCRKNDLSLSVSSGAFRREVLAANGLIKPQYTPAGNGYPRYDYRKKIDSIEETVLNLSPEILTYSQHVKVA